MSETQHRSGFVALVGRPNVGKSTLLNMLVGAPLAIVSPKPQTTRNRLIGVKSLPQAQCIFVDTPGIHHNRSSLLNRRMVEAALSAVYDTDVLVFVVDAQRGLLPEDESVAAQLSERQAPVVVVINKLDLIGKAALLPLMERLAMLVPERDIIPVSARTGENMEALMHAVIPLLPVGPALYPDDELTDQSERGLAQEIVREQLFLQTQQEVPYAVAVAVEEFTEKPEKQVLVIGAAIYVERSSQRAIIIGRRGARLKQIGQAARLRLEAVFGCKVFLQLFVKVSKNWTNRLEMLKELGL
jgi:GTPase